MTPSVRFVLPLLLALVGMPAVPSRAADGAGDPACTGRSVNPEVESVSCAAASTPRPYTITVRFAGGHDDTKASLTATVDDRPYPCADGSKTRLFGEDGEISLFCRVALPDATGRLDLRVDYTHAQFVGHEVGLD